MGKKIASDEINNYYRMQQKESAAKSILVKGIKWNLSKSHTEKDKDICDQYATQDLYGLGPGVYPVSKVPIGHKGCRCYLTDVLYQGDELIARLKEKYKTETRWK